MDITQRNMHELQTRASMSPPPPAPTSTSGGDDVAIARLHPPIAALVSQRREALVRTNPRLRHVVVDIFKVLFSKKFKTITIISEHTWTAAAAAAAAAFPKSPCATTSTTVPPESATTTFSTTTGSYCFSVSISSDASVPFRRKFALQGRTLLLQDSLIGR
jgi:hypothetical protein